MKLTIQRAVLAPALASLSRVVERRNTIPILSNILVSAADGRLADAPTNSIVTDPPYALVSIGKRSGKPGAAPTKDGDVYSRASAGFMGQQWDTGETAFAAEFWAEALRVLKPGGHLLAFSGTRTYHRMVCAIEDAGFEIRDQLAWVYGSGFPKSHDVSKAIDKRRDWAALPRLQAAIRAARNSNSKSSTID